MTTNTPRKHSIRAVAITACLLAMPALAAAHPQFLYSASDVPSLQAKATGSQKVLFDSLKAGASAYLGSRIASSGVVTWTSGSTYDLGDRRDIGNSLVLFAFVAAVTGDPAYYALAHEWLMDVVGFGNFDVDGTADLTQAHILAGAAIAYDLLANQLTSTEAASARAAIAQNAAALMNAGLNGAWWAPEYVQNHNWINCAAVGIAGLVLQGEVSSASSSAWIQFASNNAAKVKQVVDLTLDGTWHEGFAYETYGLMWHLPFVSALKRLNGLDLTDLKGMRAYGQTRAHVAVPDRSNQYVLGSGDFYGFNRDEGLFPLRWAAATYRDGVAQAEADRWAAGVTRTTYGPELAQAVFEFVYDDPSLPAASLSSQPLDWFGGDMQGAVFRSGWDAGATVLAIKSGAFGGMGNWARMATGAPPGGNIDFGHDHADDNGFYLYGQGAWLAPEAEGYYIGQPSSPGPAANQTVFHNSLTIDGAGQLGEGVRDHGDDTIDYAWSNSRHGGIPFFASTAHAGYAIAVGASLYPSSVGLTRWDRHVLFLDRKWVVLRDVLEASASHAYGWTTHFMSSGSREGSWLHGVADNGQALGVAVVAPASFNASFFNQSPVHVDKFNPAGYVAAAQVTPASPSANVTFLTALVPVANASWSSRPAVAAVDPSQPDGALTVTAGTHVAVAMFNSAATGTRQASGYFLAGEAGVAEYDSSAPSRAVLVNGTSLSDSQRTLVTQTTPTSMLEADGLSSSALSLSGDVGGKPRIWAPNATAVAWNGEPVPFTRDGAYVQIGAIDTGTPDAGTGSTGGGTGAGGGAAVIPDGGTSGGSGATVGGGGSSQASAAAHSCSATGSELGTLWLLILAAIALRRRIARS